ncbi:MAG: hypothetical protein ACREQ3_27645 [Candidatus Binatia bacterium]
MRFPSRMFGIGLALLALTVLAGTSQLRAQERSENAVQSITKFEVPAGEMANFLEMTARANEIHEQHGSVAEVRVWQEVLAGDDFGIAIHSKEYPSFEEMAADYSRVHPTPEWQEFLQEFSASGVKVVSNSLQWEMIP